MEIRGDRQRKGIGEGRERRERMVKKVTDRIRNIIWGVKIWLIKNSKKKEIWEEVHTITVSRSKQYYELYN